MNPISGLCPMMTAAPPSYRPGEIVVDRCLHWAGLAAGAAAIAVLIAAASHQRFFHLPVTRRQRRER
jgi:hypothetical protein